MAIVTDLSLAITKTQFEIGCYFKLPPVKDPRVELPGTHGITRWTDNLFALTSVKKEYEKVYIYTNNINELLPFLEYKSNPLVPSKIAGHLNDLYMAVEYSLPVSKDESFDNYILLSIKATKEEGTTKYMYFYKTRTEFNEQVENLRQEIINWLRKYGAEDINL